MHYPPRIIVLTFREGCLCTPIQEGLNMRNLRTNLSCLAVLAGIAAVSLAASGGSAFAAKACSGGPVCGMKADGPKTYDSACAAKADGTKSRISGPASYSARASALRLSQRRCAGWIPSRTPGRPTRTIARPRTPARSGSTTVRARSKHKTSWRAKRRLFQPLRQDDAFGVNRAEGFIAGCVLCRGPGRISSRRGAAAWRRPQRAAGSNIPRSASPRSAWR